MYEVLADVLKPPAPVDYLAWAKENIVFSSRESEFDGPYNEDLFKYFSEVLNALSPDDRCRIVTLIKSAQIGGTVVANIFTGGSLDMDPGDFMYVHPTDDNAVRWSKMKLSPMLKGTTALRKIFPSRPRDGQDSVKYKERTDGQGAILISGANSPASLSQVSVSRQVQDDLAKWEMNSAGDPETQADSRSQAREFAKILKVSTPMVIPGCRITKSFEAGSQEYPYVPCPHCGHMQVLEWENMLETLDEAHPEKAHFTCTGEGCGCAIEEYHRVDMIPHVEWRAKNPSEKRYHRSFHIWSAYSPLQSFEKIARAWLSAKGDPSKEQAFMNDTVGRAYRVMGDAPSWEKLRDRAAESHYRKGQIPAGFVYVTCGVDCQDDRVEFQVVAWGENKRRAVVDYEVIQGHISEPQCQSRLNALLKQTWRNAHGRQLSIDMLAIDGNAYTEDVWSWAKKHPASRVIMVRGRHEDHLPLLAVVKREYNNQGKKRPWSRRFYNFASSVLKMSLYRNVRKEDPEDTGYVLFPHGLDDEYFKQLTAESRKPKRKNGFIHYIWVKDPNLNNEGLDTHLQAEAAWVRRAGVGRDLFESEWAKLFKDRECPPEEVQGDFENLLVGMGATPEESPAPKEPERPQRKKRERRRKWNNR